MTLCFIDFLYSRNISVFTLRSDHPMCCKYGFVLCFWMNKDRDELCNVSYWTLLVTEICLTFISKLWRSWLYVSVLPAKFALGLVALEFRQLMFNGESKNLTSIIWHILWSSYLSLSANISTANTSGYLTEQIWFSFPPLYHLQKLWFKNSDKNWTLKWVSSGTSKKEIAYVVGMWKSEFFFFWSKVHTEIHRIIES